MSLKRQFAWSMLPLCSVTVVNIISVPLFYRYLGPEMYALWFYVLTFSGMFGFADLGLNSAIGRYIGMALRKGDLVAVRQYWGTANMIVIPLLTVMALAFVGLGVLFGPKWFDKLQPENVTTLQYAFVCGGVGLFISYYSQMWLVLSQAHLDFKFIGILRTIMTLVQVFLSLWLAYLTHNPVILILGGVAIGILQLGVYVWHALKNYQVGLNLRDASRARAQEMSGYTAKIFGSLMVNCFFGPMDRLLLGRLVPPSGFSHYNISYNFGARVQGLSVAVMGPVFHHTSRAMGKEGEKHAAGIFNETFDFMFDWYALIAIWIACWHPILLRLWLGRKEPGLAEAVSPIFTPLVIAFCIAALANISGAQLGPLNRAGTQLGFNIANSLALAVGVLLGWHWGGLSGVAWGVLASRVVLIVQDLYVIRLIGGGGWLSPRTWKHLFAQLLVAGIFIPAYLFFPRESYWLIIFALLHGVGVAVWVLRHPVKKFLKRAMNATPVSETAAPV